MEHKFVYLFTYIFTFLDIFDNSGNMCMEQDPTSWIPATWMPWPGNHSLVVPARYCYSAADDINCCIKSAPFTSVISI